jgi:hypothetical protein
MIRRSGQAAPAEGISTCRLQKKRVEAKEHPDCLQNLDGRRVTISPSRAAIPHARSHDAAIGAPRSNELPPRRHRIATIERAQSESASRAVVEEPLAKAQHRWTEGDDLVAFYLSRHGTRRLPLMEAGIAKLLGMSEGSMARRRGNFAYLDGRGGLPHAAKQSRRVRQQYEKATEPEL